MNYIITSAFCKVALLEDCLKYLYRDKELYNFCENEHIVIDDHYPLHTDEDKIKIYKLCIAYGCKLIVTPKNLGLHNAINFFLATHQFNDHDIIILYDADDRASFFSIYALAESIISYQDEFAVVALMFDKIRKNFDSNGYEEISRTPLDLSFRFWVHPAVDMWNIAAYSIIWIKSIGGFNEPYKYYGGLESYLYSKFDGKKLAYLPDYRSDEIKLDLNDPKFFDPEYRQWKDAHLAGDQRSFGEWLNGDVC